MGILLEPFYGDLLELVLDLSPPATERGDLGPLLKFCLAGGVRRRGRVCACFTDVEEIGPCEVHRAERDAALGRVDVGSLVDEGGVLAAKDGSHKFGG